MSTRTDTARDALAAALRDLPVILASYEATGDHNHGRGPLPPGAPCPGGDCLVAAARRAIAALGAS